MSTHSIRFCREIRKYFHDIILVSFGYVLYIFVNDTVLNKPIMHMGKENICNKER